jgi:hypothetical protein
VCKAQAHAAPALNGPKAYQGCYALQYTLNGYKRRCAMLDAINQHPQQPSVAHLQPLAAQRLEGIQRLLGQQLLNCSIATC